MSVLLHIDTAVENASVCISKDESNLGMVESTNQKDHASWIQPAISSLIKKYGLTMQQLNAVVVSNGPGSYTGLRVGLATAKGICYALSIPLITLSTLEIMATSAITTADANLLKTTGILFCPMIDARRMEVFTGLYDKKLNRIRPPHATIVDEKTFENELASHKILFFGNGAEKAKGMIRHPNALFQTIGYDASYMIALAEKKMQVKEFADLAYVEPFYIKDFHTIRPKN